MRRPTADEGRFIGMVRGEGGPEAAAAGLLQRLEELETAVASLESAVRERSADGSDPAGSLIPGQEQVWQPGPTERTED